MQSEFVESHSQLVDFCFWNILLITYFFQSRQRQVIMPLVWRS